MTKLDRLISHTKTRAKKVLAGKRYKRELRGKERRLSKDDLKLIVSAAELALDRKRGRGKPFLIKSKRCAAYKWEGLKCRRFANESGYCQDHRPKGEK